jgi:hypothetical protein
MIHGPKQRKFEFVISFSVQRIATLGSLKINVLLSIENLCFVIKEGQKTAQFLQEFIRFQMMRLINQRIDTIIRCKLDKQSTKYSIFLDKKRAQFGGLFEFTTYQNVCKN